MLLCPSVLNSILTALGTSVVANSRLSSGLCGMGENANAPPYDLVGSHNNGQQRIKGRKAGIVKRSLLKISRSGAALQQIDAGGLYPPTCSRCFAVQRVDSRVQ